MAERKKWSHEDNIVACALYAVTPYSKLHRGNPQIVTVAEKLDCTPDALAHRVTGFAGLDPVGQAKGHKGFASSSEDMRAVWAEFQQDWQKVMKQAEEIVGPLREEK